MPVGKGLSARGGHRKSPKQGRPPRPVGFSRYRQRGRHRAFTPTDGRNTLPVDGVRVRRAAIGRVRMTEPAALCRGHPGSLEADRRPIAFPADTGEAPPSPRPDPTVGGDTGSQALATPRDADQRTNIVTPRARQADPAELRRLNRASIRARKVHGTRRPSHRREAPYARRRRPHARVPRPGHDHHQAATAIAKRGGPVKAGSGPARGGGATGDRDASSATPAGRTNPALPKYKRDRDERAFRRMDRRYPASKTGRACGAVKPSRPLSERTVRRPPCGCACDRDGNAARNLPSFPPAARSAVTGAEPRKASRHPGLPGR